MAVPPNLTICANPGWFSVAQNPIPFFIYFASFPANSKHIWCCLSPNNLAQYDDVELFIQIQCFN